MIIQPDRTMLQASVSILIAESIDLSRRETIQEHETVLPCKEAISIPTWYMGMVDIDRNDDGDVENSDRTGIYRPYEVLGNDSHFCDPANVLKLTNATLDTILQLAEHMIADKELIGYGLIITDNNGNFANPLHPLVAQEIRKKGKLPFDEFTVLFYPVKTEYNEVNKNDEMKDYIKDLLTHIDIHYDDADYNIQDIEAITERIVSDYENQGYKHVINEEYSDPNQPKHLITPISLTDIRGVIYPYYGVIQSHTDGTSYYSVNLAPMCTGNVSRATTMYDEDSLDNGENDIYTETEYDNTCIGKYSPTEWTNFRHMNIMNVQSMFADECISEDYRQWVYQCIKESIKILKQLQGVEDGQEREETRHEETRTEEISIQEEAEPQSTGHVQLEQALRADVRAEDAFPNI